MRLLSDDRAQAIQIGAVLIFGLIIVLLASYQAFVVPSQNAEIDFNHHQDVDRDMVDLRAEILQAKTTGEDRFATVRLGTEYPSRVFARNGPSPSGTLRTTENKTMTVDVNRDGTNDLPDLFDRFEPENKFIQFEPRYAHFRDAGKIRFENTVVYEDFDNTNVVRSNQRLLRDDTISLIPIHRDFQASGRQKASIEPIPGILETEEVEDVTLTLGTELREEDWEEILSDEIEENDNLDEDDITVDEDEGEVTLVLDGDYTLEYAPVGMDRSPFGGVRGTGELEINPAAPGDIRYEGVEIGPTNSDLTITFNNTADTNNFTEARIAFYNHDGGEGNLPSEADLTNGPTEAGEFTTLEFRDAMKRLNEKVTLTTEQETEINLRFYDSGRNTVNVASGSWFVLEFRLQTGEKATYFIRVP